MAKMKFDSVKVGDEIPEIVIKGVTRPDFVRYAGASGDFVPLHYDQTFVEAAGIPTVFAQGMFTAGLLSKAVTDYVGIGNVRRFKVRFATRVWPGDVVTCRARSPTRSRKNGEKQIEGDLVVMNQKGEAGNQGQPSRGLRVRDAEGRSLHLTRNPPRFRISLGRGNPPSLFLKRCGNSSVGS